MKEFNVIKKLMGSQFSLGVVAENEEQANEWLTKGIEEIERIERLLSEFLPDAVTSLINRNAGEEPVQIDQESYGLLERCLAISQLTHGDFDITVGPLKQLYQFKNKEFEMPASALIEETLERVGYQKLILDKTQSTIQFAQQGMKISFAAIGKGYASDRVKKIWLQSGVSSGYINASGDLNAFGLKADQTPWKIGIADPNQVSKTLLNVPLQNGAVATSGDAEQHFIWKGVRYAHNINPHSGQPLSQIKSVTIFSPSAELSDALATAVYVKGWQKGIAFIDQLPQTHSIIIDEKNKIHFSKNLKYEAITV